MMIWSGNKALYGSGYNYKDYTYHHCKVILFSCLETGGCVLCILHHTETERASHSYYWGYILKTFKGAFHDTSTFLHSHSLKCT